jgi:hypothetical protein
MTLACTREISYQQPRSGVVAILFVTGQQNDAFL